MIFVRSFCIIFVVLIFMCSACQTKNQCKEIDLEDSAQVMFYFPHHVVYGVPFQSRDGSFSMSIKTFDTKDCENNEIGVINYLGIYPNSYAYSNNKVYACFAYDTNYIDNQNIRLIEIDVNQQSVNVLFEFLSNSKIIYTKSISDSKLLIYGIENEINDIYYSQIIIFDLNKNVVENELQFISNNSKPIIADCDGSSIYIIYELFNQYKIDKYSINLKKISEIDIGTIQYFFNNSENELLTIQHLKVRYNTFLITLFGGGSIVFEYNPNAPSITEKYIGDSLSDWDNIGYQNTHTTICSNGKKSYKIDFFSSTITEYDEITLDVNVLHYVVFSYDYKNILVKSRYSSNDGTFYKKYTLQYR